MFSNLLTWLHDENNRAIVGMIGGAFAFLWTAGWAVFVWWQEKKKEEDEQPVRTASHERQRKPKPVKQGWSVFLRTSILAWAIGIVFLAAIWFAWLSPEKVVTVQYRLCLGEYERNCGFDHDVYLYCYTDVDAWASGRCLRHTATSIGSHDGNKCGYTNVSVACVQRAP